MRNHFQRNPHPTETGGITILVALMLLVLLTIAAVGMSRNSFREIVTSGFSRQGSMARNVADSGIEWSIHWIDLANGSAAVATDIEATKLTNLKKALLMDSTLAGVAKDVNSASATAPTDYAANGTLPTEFQLPHPTGVVQGFTLGLTRMGKLPIADLSQGSGAGAFTPASGGPLNQAPDFWAIRSDAQVQQGNVTFVHAKEVWISTPVQ